MIYLNINLTIYTQDLYVENYKTLIKIKDLNKWTIFHVHALEDITLLRSPFLSTYSIDSMKPRKENREAIL